MNIHTIILAAGKGTRMNTNLPKVMQSLGGHTLISHVIKTAKKNSKNITVVVGHQKDLLKEQDYTHASPKSFNNHFGVPLSLANLNIRHKFGIFEVGMSKAGEIDNLSKMIKPDIAIITNIAEAHIENFKNIHQCIRQAFLY